MNSKKPIYILGTGLSHNGSVVLLKNGTVCVAIEKERLSRIKHDGDNDTVAVQYCLDAEGIKLSDIDLVVQCANFDIPKPDFYRGKRLFSATSPPKVIDISHHLAHAYSAVGTSPFSKCMAVVIDGCGSPLDQYLEIHPEQRANVNPTILARKELLFEKDSFYFFNGQTVEPLYKDFSELATPKQEGILLPITKNSIGGFYAAISNYVFRNMDDVGKLMGLAPFGKSSTFNFRAFEFDQDNLIVKDEWKKEFNEPSPDYDHFKAKFQYYANVAKWAQEQIEWAILNCIKKRIHKFPHENLCYSGGVALNAVANAKLQDANIVKNIYIEPAATDNGLALGCAFYGWLEYLKMPKVPHDGNTCFGKTYDLDSIHQTLNTFINSNFNYKQFPEESILLKHVAQALNQGKTVGWFQSGAEFGPRALGRRSILAHPGIDHLKDHINLNIKFREDFRPFAPAILKKEVHEYFEVGRNSPYMILVDKTRLEYREQLKNVTHCDGSARVQTVEESWNPRFHRLIEAFHLESGIPVLLNTSLNRKGMPIVETPEEAIRLFESTALDLLVIEDFILKKHELRH